MERDPPDSEPWAQAVGEAWDSRRRAAPCGSTDIFCGCERCAALPEKPAWMASPEALVAMAERLVAAAPEDRALYRVVFDDEGPLGLVLASTDGARGRAAPETEQN